MLRLDDGFELPRLYPHEVKWSPTAVDVDARGCVWVADGYGPSLVHRYTLNSPHTLAADSAGDLYVAEWLIGGRVTKLSR